MLLSWEHVVAFPGESDLYRLSHAEECHSPPRSSASLHVHFPVSTYTLGRNVLYFAVCWQELRQGWRYSYYIYADDDVQAVDGGGARSLSQADIRDSKPRGPHAILTVLKALLGGLSLFLLPSSMPCLVRGWLSLRKRRRRIFGWCSVLDQPPSCQY